MRHLKHQNRPSISEARWFNDASLVPQTRWQISEYNKVALEGRTGMERRFWRLCCRSEMEQEHRTPRDGEAQSQVGVGHSGRKIVVVTSRRDHTLKVQVDGGSDGEIVQ